MISNKSVKKNRILIIPDSFKDSINSDKVAAAILQGLKLNKNFNKYELKALPFADGGEGSLEVLKQAAKIKIITIKTFDSLMRKVNVKIGFDDKSKTGYIEMAQICGLQMLKPSERNPMNTTTYGIGDAIKKLLNKKIENIVLFIGGSSTNDAGCGLMQSLGLTFIDNNNNEITNVISGKDLANIKSFNTDNFIKELNSVNFLICCDVKNKLYGRNGAAYIYGKQKGAGDEEIRFLNKGLINISSVYETNYNTKISLIEGTGAAGGIALGLLRFCTAKLISGAEYLSDLYKLDNEIKKSKLIITGEGSLDNQSLSGKLISVIYKKAEKYNKKVLIACGGMSGNFNIRKYKNIIGVLPVMNKDITQEYAINNAYTLLKNIFKSISLELL